MPNIYRIEAHFEVSAEDEENALEEAFAAAEQVRDAWGIAGVDLYVIEDEEPVVIDEEGNG